jgi:tetratricopeptide (TPR) repeat protein
MEENDLENSTRIYGKLAQEFPDYFAGHYLMGRVNLKKGDFKEAEKYFNKSIELEPELDEAKYDLIEIFKSQGKTDNVIQMYRSILEKNPESIRSAMELGYFYHENGKKEEAEAYFIQLGRKSLSEEEIIRQVFNLYLDQKAYDAALVILTGMLKGAPNHSDIHYLLGLTHDGKEDKEKSFGHMRKVELKSKFYPNATVHIAFLFQEQGKLADAISYLEEALPRLPDHADFYLYLGSFYEEAENFTKAEEVLKKGIEKDAKNARIIFRLGVVYDKMNRKEESMETMKKVIALEPENASALNYLGYTYADLGRNLDEAEKLIKEALKYKPDDGYITDSLGWVYFKKGEYQAALELILKASTLVEDDPIILEHLGDIYVQMKNIEKALESYERSLKVKKKDTEEIEKKIRELRK